MSYILYLQQSKLKKMLRKSYGRENIFMVFIEKNLWISEPVYFETMLFKTQLYIEILHPNVMVLGGGDFGGD